LYPDSDAMHTTTQNTSYTLDDGSTEVLTITHFHYTMYQVETEFVHIIQHGMPFVQDVNHTALLKTLQEYPN
jgi:Fe-S cluster assembly ATPase SufC